MNIFESIESSPLYQNVRRFIHEQHLLDDVEHIDIALSGGADSVALTAILATLRTRENFCPSLRTHHIRHGLRNDALDAEIARKIAQIFSIEHIQTNLELGKLQSGTEAIARNARYNALFNALPNSSKNAVALAHHGDENVETALWRLGRGCGVEGFSMPPRRFHTHRQTPIAILRPLLTSAKNDIYAFLKHNHLPWVEDPTNNDDKYKRNRIRHSILENFMRESAAPLVVYQSLIDIRGDADALSSFADFCSDKFKIDESKFFIPFKDWNFLHIAAQKQLLRHTARQLNSHAATREWVERAHDTISRNAQSKRACIDGNLKLLLSKTGFTLQNTDITPVFTDPIDVPIPAKLDIPNLGTLSIFTATPQTLLKNDTHFLGFHAPSPLPKLTLRPAKHFQTLTTTTGSKTKTREALRAQNIPNALHPLWPVLCANDTPIWVLGGMRTLDAKPPILGENAIFVQWIPNRLF